MIECIFCDEPIRKTDRRIECKDRKTGEECQCHDDCWWHCSGYVTHERTGKK
jgi:hypothetical protein